MTSISSPLSWFLFFCRRHLKLIRRLNLFRHAFTADYQTATNKNKIFKVYESTKPNLSWRKIKPGYKNLKKIGEFRYVQKKGSWALKKARFDKTTPNSLKVLINTFKIITECITKIELIDNVAKFQTRKERGKCCKKYQDIFN